MRTSRRSFLHGMGGAVLALPWLESLGDAAVNTVPALRAAWFYVPIGVVRRGFFPGEADAAIPQFSSNREALPNTARLPVGLLPLELTPTMKPRWKRSRTKSRSLLVWTAPFSLVPTCTPNAPRVF